MRSDENFPDLPDELNAATFIPEYWHEFVRSPWVSAWTAQRRLDAKNGAPRQPVHREETEQSTVTPSEPVPSEETELSTVRPSRENNTQSFSGTPSLEQPGNHLERSAVAIPRDAQLQCVVINSDHESAPVNVIALLHDAKARTDGTSVNVYDLSFSKFRQWVNLDVMFYEDTKRNLIAVHNEDPFHMALIQMMYERSPRDDAKMIFQFTVLSRGKRTSFSVVTSG